MKKTSKVSAIIFIAVGILFLLYGCYSVYTGLQYTSVFVDTATMNTLAVIEYIVTASSAYFGFGFILIATSLIITKVNKIIDMGLAAPAPVEESKPAKFEVPEPLAEPAKVEAPAIPKEAVEEVKIDEETGKPEFEVEYLYEEVKAEAPAPAPVAEPEDNLPIDKTIDQEIDKDIKLTKEFIKSIMNS